MTRRLRSLVLVVSAIVLVLASLAPAAAAPAASMAVEDRADILIERDTEFDAEHGVRSGRGTARDPYVISHWRMGNLRIHDTQSYFTIHHVEVGGTMVLDWTGRGLRLVDNLINDLRVNRNVARSGKATTGLIARNTFRVIGQLRHWDGVFERNTVGAVDTVGNQAVNFDGFNGARFRNNTLYGTLDATLHGHHHGSGFGRASHDHAGEAMSEEHADHAGHGYAPANVDHSRRYHEVWITGNTIQTTQPFALTYNDVAHAVNDRTNASETDPELEKPHQHFTRIHLIGNRLTGGLAVTVFNQTDELHTRTNRGLVEIRGNRISVARQGFNGWFAGPDGLVLSQVVHADVRVVGNVIQTGAAEGLGAVELFRDYDQGAGIRLGTFDRARVYLYDNTVVARPYGISAAGFTESVRWWIRGLRTEDVATPVAYDEASVPNKPTRS
ncbi:MAG: hypothetical protein WD770_02665 [Actinomycetota bacterium]